MTYLNIQDLSGKCNQRHVNLSIYLADSTRHTFGKPWKRSCRLILLTKPSGFFLSMSRPRWVLKSNGIWKALFVSAGDRGRSTNYLSISLLHHGNPWIWMARSLTFHDHESQHSSGHSFAFVLLHKHPLWTYRKYSKVIEVAWHQVFWHGEWLDCMRELLGEILWFFATCGVTPKHGEKGHEETVSQQCS